MSTRRWPLSFSFFSFLKSQKPSNFIFNKYYISIFQNEHKMEEWRGVKVDELKREAWRIECVGKIRRSEKERMLDRINVENEGCG